MTGQDVGGRFAGDMKRGRRWDARPSVAAIRPHGNNQKGVSPWPDDARSAILSQQVRLVRLIVVLVALGSLGLALWWAFKGRFEALEKRMGAIEARMDRLEAQFDSLRSEMTAMRSDITMIALAVGAKPRAGNA